jgi:hypothetical protein
VILQLDIEKMVKRLEYRKEQIVLFQFHWNHLQQLTMANDPITNVNLLLIIILINQLMKHVFFVFCFLATAKDTSPYIVDKETFVPAYKSFEDDLSDTYGIKIEKKRAKTYVY